ncbi:MAG TPA: hypothetical protein VKY45_11180 [Marinilabiliaceae bacterium]|nr:hypothetical protein [Marinilabiliaceae bacterium]
MLQNKDKIFEGAILERIMLSVSFHQTFIPERRLIAALLDYAFRGHQGTIKEMSDATGIPMGKSSGKMPAILDYCKGMGLIEVQEELKGIKRPVLTQFGALVQAEDRFLGEEIVQWIVHMNLCRGDIGAKTWHEIFAKSCTILGSNFSKLQMEDYLINVCGQGKDRIGPMITTYLDDAALKRAGSLFLTNELINRRKAPILEAYAIPYALHLLSLLETNFPGQGQVTVSDFLDKTLWFNICHWNENDAKQVFSIIETCGYISIDRQMKPWIIEIRKELEDKWSHFFDDIA